MTDEAAATESSEVSGNGLFGAVETPAPNPASDESSQSPTDVPPSSPSEWHWADGIKGDGQRPDWLKERYKSVSEQAVAYSELEKKFGEFRGAPKDGYVMDGIEGLDVSNPLLKGLSETFKELNMSQAGFERVVNEYLTAQTQSYQTDIKEEMKKMGPGAEQQIAQTKQWIQNNLDKHDAQTISTWIHSAEDMKALQALMAFQPLSRSPSAEAMNSSLQYESLQDVKNEKTQNWLRYKEEPVYRRSVQDRMRMAELRSGRK